MNISKIIDSCDTLGRMIISVGGKNHGSTFLFDKCMRAFTDVVPAEAITFEVYFNAPIMKPGEATIHRDGRLEMHTTK